MVTMIAGERFKGIVPLYSYRFKEPGSVIFLTGAPLSGKSTIAPVVSMQIKDCAIQHMDVIRLLSQEIESLKPESERDKFVMFGSTDAYTQVETGVYSDKALIEGYIRYSKAVTKHFLFVLQQLNPEDINNMLIEGVQLLPEITLSYLMSHSGLLVILKSNGPTFKSRVEKRYSDPSVRSKYNPEMLELIQNTLLSQSKIIPQNKLLIVENDLTPLNTVNTIITSLINKGVLIS